MSSEQLRLPSYGGQALIEGVLMRGKKFVAAAMRAPDGQIVFTTEELKGIYLSRLSKIPLLRGLILLWDALGLGMRFLVQSANVQTGENEKIEGASLYLTITMSLLFSIAIFFALPAGVGYFFEIWAGVSSTAAVWIESLIRTVLMVVYIWGIGKMPEISLFFGYHGAEHKTINAYEAGAEMKPEIVQQYSVQHPRCGTGFLLIVVIISVFVFGAIGPLPILFRILSRVLLVPVIAMLAYEYMRWTANHAHNPIVKWLIWPNLAMQKLTTREPSIEMIEVSLAAFNQMLLLEEQANQLT